MNRARQIALPRWAYIVLVLVLGGCMHERHREIPADAAVVAEGNSVIAYRPATAGHVWLYDRNTDRLIYSGEVDAGQMIEVNPQNDRVSVNGQTVLEKGIRDAGNSRRIFFKPGATVERKTIIRETRIEERK